jgi:hypothetical protein
MNPIETTKPKISKVEKKRPDLRGILLELQNSFGEGLRRYTFAEREYVTHSTATFV